MPPLQPHIADALHRTHRAGEKGVDSHVADPVVGHIQPHVIGGVEQPFRKQQAVRPRRVRRLPRLRMCQPQIQLAIAKAVVPAAREQRFAVGNELRNRCRAAVLHQRLPQIRTRSAVGIISRGTHPVDRAGGEIRRCALLFGLARQRQGDQFPDRGGLAKLDLSFFQEGAGHDAYFSSFFPIGSPPSAMVSPRLGTWKACPSYEATRSATS